MQDVFERDDELSIPEAGYELPSRRAGTGNRRLVIIAALIGVVLVGVGGGLEMATRRGTEVPVITADTHPIRVRPDSPGGMQVIGANEGAADSGAEAMAPPPEAPNTTALRAQQQADLTKAQPSPLSGPPLPTASQLATSGSAAPDVPLPPMARTPAGETPAAVALPPAHGRPGPALAASASSTLPAPASAVLPATPAPAPRVVAPAPARATVAAAAPEAAGGGHRIVQLAAVSSEELANSEWERLSKRMPDLLGGRHPDIVRFEHDGHTYWRLRTGGFADNADAAAFCGRIKAKGGNCAVF